MKQVIAIDGPSGSGKTTVAKSVAKELGFHYLDTGALYRAIALALRTVGIQPEDTDDTIMKVLGQCQVFFQDGRVFMNGKDVSESIRSKEMDHYSSVFSARKIVRDFLLDAQRNAAFQNDLVVEGRDTTTVVFPQAKKKIFLNATLEERAKRRYLQFREKGIDISMDEARENMRDRDKRDASRDIAPMTIAPDALKVDSSNLTIEQVTHTILDFVRSDH
jgi:cytidylate kinase